MLGEVLHERYRILAKLGEGGMGVVYQALDNVLDRLVAVKVLHSHQKAVAHRFRSEAKIIARLDHSNIVHVYDFFQHGEQLCIAMQLVDGITLADRISDEGAIPGHEAVSICTQLLRALSHAHCKGVIHRDVKPGNVLLGKEGSVKLTDFGLAKDPQSDVKTHSTSTAGTPCYMPPEQLQALANADQRSDVYSTGMTLYEMLAGRLPFDKHASVYVLSKIITEKKFPPPDHYNPAVPATLAQVVMKAIDKEPARRYESADEMLGALAQYLDAQKTALPPPPRSRRPTIVALLSAFALTACVTALLLFSQPWQNQSEQAPTLTNPTENLTASSPHREETVNLITPAAEDSIDAHKGEKHEPDSVAPPTSGSVTTDSEPSGAEIWFDHQPHGKTPLTISDLALGNHTIVLKKVGYEDYSDSVNVEARKEKKIQVKLIPLTGRLIVVVKPLGSISLDGVLQRLESAEPFEIKLPIGAAQVSIENSELGTWEKTVSIQADSLHELAIDFNATATITIASSPVWAEIYVDDQPIGQQTPYVHTLRIGKHVIEVRRAGYVVEGGVREINLEDDLEEPLEFRLRKIE